MQHVSCYILVDETRFLLKRRFVYAFGFCQTETKNTEIDFGYLSREKEFWTKGRLWPKIWVSFALYCGLEQSIVLGLGSYCSQLYHPTLSNLKLSNPQLNHNSTLHNLSWVRHENDFASHPSQTNSLLAISVTDPISMKL